MKELKFEDAFEIAKKIDNWKSLEKVVIPDKREPGIPGEWTFPADDTYIWPFEGSKNGYLFKINCSWNLFGGDKYLLNVFYKSKNIYDSALSNSEVEYKIKEFYKTLK